MENKLHSQFEDCLKDANNEEQKALSLLLEGFLNKKRQKNVTYIGGLLQMNASLDETSCEVSIPITALTHNSLGIVHGGITATLVDSAMGTLANQFLPKDYGAVTSSLQIHYLSPGKYGSLRAKAHVIHQGKNTMMVEGKVLNDEDKVIAHSTASFFILKKRK
ncbi:PaaI family thioesterase [Bacillus sp. 2205SS5-2]|uniref:PaaI family thioesterase n=1 Tax=Bacillus sp. 2205SS5-2 TaxID=3109031 RepID=UPI0030065527